jgi:hypothetical protein
MKFLLYSVNSDFSSPFSEKRSLKKKENYMKMILLYFFKYFVTTGGLINCTIDFYMYMYLLVNRHINHAVLYTCTALLKYPSSVITALPNKNV